MPYKSTFDCLYSRAAEKGYLLGNWVDGRSWPGLVIVLGLNFYISNVMHD